jgi:hypothetical protein
MTQQQQTSRAWLWRSRWAAIGAAVTVAVGGGGWFVANAASSPPSTVVTIDPVRILDTRDPLNVGLDGPFSSRVPQKLQVTGPVPTTSGIQTAVPIGATGVLLNVTVVGPTAAGFLSVRPGDATGLPTTSSLNFAARDIVPNAVQVGLPTVGSGAGRIDITYDAFGATGPTTDVLVDVVGYTTQLDAYTKSETDAAIAASAQTITNQTSAAIADSVQTITAGGVSAATVLPPVQLAMGTTSVTTTRTGHLELSFIGAGGLQCASTFLYRGWIEIDVGSPATPNYVPVRSSVISVGENFTIAGVDMLSATNLSQKVLHGVTATPVPAGTHRIRTAFGCLSGTGTDYLTTGFSWIVKVLPSTPTVAALEMSPADDDTATMCTVDPEGVETCR